MLKTQIFYENPIEIKVFSIEEFVEKVSKTKFKFQHIIINFKTSDMKILPNNEFQIKPIKVLYAIPYHEDNRWFLKYKHFYTHELIKFIQYIPIINIQNYSSYHLINKNTKYHYIKHNDGYVDIYELPKYYHSELDNYINTHPSDIYISEQTFPEILANSQITDSCKHISLYDLLNYTYKNNIFYNFKYNSETDTIDALLSKLPLKHILKNYNFNSITHKNIETQTDPS